MRTKMEMQRRFNDRMHAYNIKPEQYGLQYAVETPNVSYRAYDWSCVIDDNEITRKIEADRRERTIRRQRTQERMRRRTLSYKIKHFFGLA